MTDIRSSYAYENMDAHDKIGTPAPPSPRVRPTHIYICPTLTPHGKKGIWSHLITHLYIVYRKFLHLNYKVYEINILDKGLKCTVNNTVKQMTMVMQ